MMSYRRIIREWVLQILFYSDISCYDTAANLRLFYKSFSIKNKHKLFFERLFIGVIKNKETIDLIIEKNSKNWKLNRMSYVDRNILRFAIFEILYCKDIPPKASINEAIDIGKKYGTINSGAFINAILDSIHMSLNKYTIT